LYATVQILKEKSHEITNTGDNIKYQVSKIDADKPTK